MGIEFSQIHNLVRTYQRILPVPLSQSPHEDKDAGEVEDRVSISPEARAQNDPSRTDSLSGGFHQQDKERPI
jgi:hypothetical protein